VDTTSAQPLWTRAFVLAWTANFLHSTGFHAYVHLPGWLEGLGASEVVIGVLIATLSVAAIASRPFVGRLMDTRGRRLLVLGGGVFHVLVPLLYLLVDAHPSWAAITAVRLVHGLAQAALFSVLFTIAADLVPERRRAEGIALFGISGMIPLAIGGLLGDWVIVDGDYRPLFWITSACAGLGLVCSLLLPETRRLSGGPGRSFLAAAMAVELRSLWFIGTAFAMGLAAYFVFLKTYLLEQPQIGTMGTFFSTYAIAAVLLRVLFGRVPERFGLVRVLIPSLLLGAGGLVVLAFASAPAHLIAAGIACGIGHGYAFPIISALVVTRAQADERGSAISLFTALFDLGLLLGGPSFGVAVKLAGYPVTFALAGGLVATASLVFLIWDRRVRVLLEAPT
jgi:MFS family permease